MADCPTLARTGNTAQYTNVELWSSFRQFGSNIWLAVPHLRELAILLSTPMSNFDHHSYHCLHNSFCTTGTYRTGIVQAHQATLKNNKLPVFVGLSGRSFWRRVPVMEKRSWDVIVRHRTPFRFFLRLATTSPFRMLFLFLSVWRRTHWDVVLIWGIMENFIWTFGYCALGCRSRTHHPRGCYHHPRPLPVVIPWVTAPVFSRIPPQAFRNERNWRKRRLNAVVTLSGS